MRSRILLSIAFIVSVAIVAVVVLSARGFLKNETVVANGPGDQDQPYIVNDDAGGTYVAWADSRGSEAAIYVQRLDAGGKALWKNGGMQISAGDGANHWPVLAGSGKGVFVGWTREDKGQLDLLLQKLDAEGETVWDRGNQVLAGDPGDQRDLRIAADGNGGLYMAYTDFVADGSHIVINRLDQDGRRLWAKDRRVSRPEAFAGDPRIMVDKDKLTVTWKQQLSDLTTDIFAQRFDLSGRRLWGVEGQVVVDAPQQEEDGRLASDGAGGLYVAWEDNRGPGVKVFAQRLDQNGARLWSKHGVGVSTAKGEQWHPEVALFDRRDLLVVWKDMRTKADDIYAQRLSRRGRRLWAAGGAPVSVAKRDQAFFQFAAARKYAYIVWRDSRGQDQDIYAQKIDGSGRSLWTKNGLAVSRAIADQQDPQVAVSDSVALVVWTDQRYKSNKRDIYLGVLR